MKVHVYTEPRPPGVPRVFEVGERYRQLTVVMRRIAPDRLVGVQCDCGTYKLVSAVELPKRLISCGCAPTARSGPESTSYRHGMHRTAIYGIWSEMRARCQRETHPRWRDYGGRGITVCPRWDSFELFYADMGDRPEGRSLDRVDNDGPYAPENCRWATITEQNNNKRPYRRREAS